MAPSAVCCAFPHPSPIKTVPPRHNHSTTLLRQFFSWGSLGSSWIVLTAEGEVVLFFMRVRFYRKLFVMSRNLLNLGRRSVPTRLKVVKTSKSTVYFISLLLITHLSSISVSDMIFITHSMLHLFIIQLISQWSYHDRCLCPTLDYNFNIHRHEVRFLHYLPSLVHGRYLMKTLNELTHLKHSILYW